jgi:hypothetical protein
MKYFISLIIGVSGLVSVTAGAWLCYKNITGWGWFLFVGVLLLGALCDNIVNLIKEK